MSEAEMYKAQAELNAETVVRQAHVIRHLESVIRKLAPEWGTPNWCEKCSPKRQGFCSCEIACNE